MALRDLPFPLPLGGPSIPPHFPHPYSIILGKASPYERRIWGYCFLTLLTCLHTCLQLLSCPSLDPSIPPQVPLSFLHFSIISFSCSTFCQKWPDSSQSSVSLTFYSQGVKKKHTFSPLPCLERDIRFLLAAQSPFSELQAAFLTHQYPATPLVKICKELLLPNLKDAFSSFLYLLNIYFTKPLEYKDICDEKLWIITIDLSKV